MAHVYTVPAVVVRIVDGDTLDLRLDLGFHVFTQQRCRMIGIDSPEMTTREGVDAKAYAASLVPPGTVGDFTSQRLDKYGRPLGTFRYGGTFSSFNQQMLDSGHAVVMKG